MNGKKKQTAFNVLKHSESSDVEIEKARNLCFCVLRAKVLKNVEIIHTEMGGEGFE